MVKNNWGLRSIILGLLATILLSLTVGCSTPSSTPAETQEAAKPKMGGTITVAYGTEPNSLDTHRAAEVAMMVTSQLGGTLVYSDPVTHEPKPYLAEEYKISEDGKTLTFKIRSGVTLHDGTPVTAKTFQETFERMLNPETKSEFGPVYLGAVSRINAPDDQTLVIDLKEPSAALMETLELPGLQPLSMQAIEKFGADYGRNPVGAGPWKFESWQSSQAITLVRNESFTWGESFNENKGPVRADKLVIKFIQDKQTMLASLDSGTIDVATEVPAKDIKKYKNNPKFEIVERTKPGIGLMVEMNQRNPGLQDREVRKAINMLVNKETIIKSVLQGEGIVANGPLGPSMLGYDKSVEAYGYQYNTDEANKLLDAAGWKVNGEGVREKDGKTLSLILITRKEWDKEAQLLQAMLSEAGIKITIRSTENVSWQEAALKGQFDLAFMSYGYPDPDILYLYFHSNQIGGLNISSVKDNELDDLLEKGRAAMNPEDRKKIYPEAQKRIIEQAYIVPIYINKEFAVVNSRVKGVKYSNYGLKFNDSWVDQ